MKRQYPFNTQMSNALTDAILQGVMDGMNIRRVPQVKRILVSGPCTLFSGLITQRPLCGARKVKTLANMKRSPLPWRKRSMDLTAR